MDFSVIVQRLNDLTTFMNNVRTLSKKIFQLPPSTEGIKWVATYNETSEETEKFNLTDALNGMYSLTNGITATGNIVRDAADFTFEVGFEWLINGIEYSNTEITRTINDAGTGNHRVDIAVCDTNNDIYIVEGFEVPLATAVVQPPTPPNTLFICSFFINESVIGDNTTPILVGQNNIPLRVEILSTDLTTNNIAGFVNYINNLNPALTVLETNSLVQYYLTDTNEIYQFSNIGKGVYGQGNLQITSSNVLNFKSGGSTPNLSDVLAEGNIANTDIIMEDAISLLPHPDGGGYYLGEVVNGCIIVAPNGILRLRANSNPDFYGLEGEQDYSLRSPSNKLIFAQRIYVDTKIDEKLAGLLDLRGAHDASSNAFPTTGGSGTSGAILKGDFWYVSVAGVLNGVTVNIGDSFFALIDSPTASDWQILESNLGYVPEDVDNKVTTMTGNTTSNIVYLTAKAIYDWAVGLFYSKTEVDDLLDAKDIKHTELNLLNDYALSSVTTAQKLFNVGTSGNGAFDVDANSLYEFEMFVYLDNLSTTSSNFSFQILGTATYSNILLRSEASKQAFIFITGSVFNGIITATTSYQLVTNSIAPTGFIKITGNFRTSSAGTFIPSILLSVANAANVKKGSNAKIKKIGSDTFTATSGIS